MTRGVCALVVAILPLLAAGNCPNNPPPPPDDGEPACALSCANGLKRDITGVTYCECRPEECAAPERPAPFVNPATGACTGFPTDCDIPTGWSVCPQCQVSECGPRPGIPDRQCSDGTVAGVFCSRHEDGDCTWNELRCPEDGEQCNQAFCPSGFGCCNWSCSMCAPAGGTCTQQACDDGT